MSWSEWVEDRVAELLALLERIAVAAERVADASERDVNPNPEEEA